MTDDEIKDDMAMVRPWRIDHSLGRTIYAMAINRASQADTLIGVMDTPALAIRVCRAHNRMLEGEGFTP